MTNREYYKEQILDIVCSGYDFGFNNEKQNIGKCKDIDCNKCAFSDISTWNCNVKKEEWANAEYVEPPVDWTKVAVDTKILVRDYDRERWEPRYFAKYENGKIYAWLRGATSWSNKEDPYPWKYAKLYKEE